MCYKSNLLEALLKVKEHVPNVNSGICDNIEKYIHIDHLEDTYDWLECQFFKWDKFSGDVIFPVPSPEGDSAEDAYIHRENVWLGAYGKLRYELLDFLIEQLIKEE